MSTTAHIAPEVDSAGCELLRRSYEAFNARDIEAALVCMDPDVDWPNGIEGGYLYGHKAVHDYWVRQWHMIDPHIEPVGFRNDEDGNIEVQVHLTVRDLEGNLLQDETVYHVYLILQGLIKRMEIRKITGTEPVAAVTGSTDTGTKEPEGPVDQRAPAGSDVTESVEGQEGALPAQWHDLLALPPQ